MINGFFNGIGATFVITYLAWMQSLSIELVVFGAVYGFVCAFRLLFNFSR